MLTLINTIFNLQIRINPLKNRHLLSKRGNYNFNWLVGCFFVVIHVRFWNINIYFIDAMTKLSWLRFFTIWMLHTLLSECCTLTHLKMINLSISSRCLNKITNIVCIWKQLTVNINQSCVLKMIVDNAHRNYLFISWEFNGEICITFIWSDAIFDKIRYNVFELKNHKFCRAWKMHISKNFFIGKCPLETFLCKVETEFDWNRNFARTVWANHGRLIPFIERKMLPFLCHQKISAKHFTAHFCEEHLKLNSISKWNESIHTVFFCIEILTTKAMWAQDECIGDKCQASSISMMRIRGGILSIFNTDTDNWCNKKLAFFKCEAISSICNRFNANLEI